MSKRYELQALLEKLIGSRNVYYQPPSNLKMSYPCIIYSRANGKALHADNVPYRSLLKYQITVIDKNPDSPIADEIEKLPTCSFDRHFNSDNLNHFVYTLYFN